RFFRGTRRYGRDCTPGADVRPDRDSRPCVHGGRKTGQNAQALGRPRGGVSTKIHLKVDLGSLSLAFHLTGGDASDSRNFELRLDFGPDIKPVRRVSTRLMIRWPIARLAETAASVPSFSIGYRAGISLARISLARISLARISLAISLARICLARI